LRRSTRDASRVFATSDLTQSENCILDLTLKLFHLPTLDWRLRVSATANACARAQLLTERAACSCSHLAKPYAAGNAALTGCFCDLANLHDLGDNEGRVEGVLTGGSIHDYNFNSTCIVCPAGKVMAAAGTSSLSQQEAQDMFRGCGNAFSVVLLINAAGKSCRLHL
jgi:hypothetical protein